MSAIDVPVSLSLPHFERSMPAAFRVLAAQIAGSRFTALSSSADGRTANPPNRPDRSGSGPSAENRPACLILADRILSYFASLEDFDISGLDEIKFRRTERPAGLA